MLKKSTLEEIEYIMLEIKAWNEETFPDATLAGQLAKLEEEFIEYHEASSPEEEMKELADVFIVLGGLRRWKSIVGERIKIGIIDRMPLKVLIELCGLIQEKMEINRKRVWKKSGDGKFHHKEGTK